MPLYLASTRSTAIAAPTNRAKKMEMVRTTPSAFHVVGIPRSPGARFQLLLLRLPSLVQSMDSTEAAIAKFPTPYNPTLPTVRSLDFALPHLAIAFERTPDTSVKEELEDMGAATSRIAGDKFDTFHIRNPSLEQLQRISEFPNMKSQQNPPAEHVNAEQAASYIIIMRVISSIIKVINVGTHEEGFTRMDQAPALRLLFAVLNRDGRAHEGAMDVEEEGQVPEGPHHMVTREQGGVTYCDHSYSETSTWWEVEAGVSQADVRWGEYSPDLATDGGLFVPYSSDYARHDPNGVPSFLIQYARELLMPEGWTSVDCGQILGGWSAIHKTEAGNYLSHIVAVLRLSFQVQRPIFPIIQGGKYQGSVIVGGKFQVCVAGGLMMRAMDAEELQEDIEAFRFHSVVLSSIADIVGGDDEVETAIREAKTMRGLRSVIPVQSLSENQRDSLRKELAFLSFGEVSLGLNVDSLCWALRMMSVDEGEMIDDDVFLRVESFFFQSRVEEVLSAFGDLVPSWNVARGRATTVRRDAVSMVKGKEVRTPFSPEILQVQRVFMGKAVQDWSSLIKNRKVTNNPPNHNQGQQFRSYKGQDRLRLWGEINEFVEFFGVKGDIDGKTTGKATEPEGRPSGGKHRLSEAEGSGMVKRAKFLF